MSQTLGIIIGTGTQTTTGNLFMTLLFILIVLLAIGMFFGIAIEYISIVLLPYLLAVASNYSNFIAPLGVFLIYLSLILTKNFLFK
jgi:hypothetical protein